eukprot:gnl/Spiro4/21354_TR10432_c0_g1_i1.p1 gnl/Spiro4/21354_TR10432_c0_g1~~gnl/Spiro4/21354_TR10432_c0_g1_i1.p1  ORF type:complete len:436 (-),score=72.85 gnl/Spiro4/21354_TR10432_c0_g1_i1:96-1403(-)
MDDQEDALRRSVRRVDRILQVRDQERQIALEMRDSVKLAKAQALDRELLALKENFDRNKALESESLSKAFELHMAKVGLAHNAADDFVAVSTLDAERDQMMMVASRERSQLRYSVALENLRASGNAFTESQKKKAELVERQLRVSEKEAHRASTLVAEFRNSQRNKRKIAKRKAKHDALNEYLDPRKTSQILKYVPGHLHLWGSAKNLTIKEPSDAPGPNAVQTAKSTQQAEAERQRIQQAVMRKQRLVAKKRANDAARKLRQLQEKDQVEQTLKALDEQQRLKNVAAALQHGNDANARVPVTTVLREHEGLRRQQMQHEFESTFLRPLRPELLTPRALAAGLRVEWDDAAMAHNNNSTTEPSSPHVRFSTQEEVFEEPASAPSRPLIPLPPTEPHHLSFGEMRRALVARYKPRTRVRSPSSERRWTSRFGPQEH